MDRTSNVFALLLAVVVVCTEGCNLYEFEICLTDFTEKYPDASNSFSPSYSEQQLVGVCRDFNIAAECVEPTIAGCGQDVRALWAVLDNVMNYMCTEQTKLILRNYSGCVEGPTLQSEISVCNRTMQSVTTRIQRYGGTRSELCSAMKTFAGCSVGAADEHCGKVVASWYGGLIDAALDPSKDLIDCHFTAGVTFTTPEVVTVRPANRIDSRVGDTSSQNSASSVVVSYVTLLAVLLMGLLAA